MKTAQIQRNISEIQEIYQLLSQVKSESSNTSSFKARRFNEELENSLKTKKTLIIKLFFEHFLQGNWMLDRVSLRNVSNEEHSPLEIPQEIDENAENPAISAKKLENPYESRENQPIKSLARRKLEGFLEERDNSAQILKETKPKFEFLRKNNKNPGKVAKTVRKPEKRSSEVQENAGVSQEIVETGEKLEEAQDFSDTLGANSTKFEFLKRKSQKIPSNKLDLTGVRSRIDCWVTKTSQQRAESKGNSHFFAENVGKSSVSRSRGTFL